MKIGYLFSTILVTGVVMAGMINSTNSPQKIRSRFTIQESYCAIKMNDVLGFSNRMNAWRKNGEPTGAISSTNSIMAMEDGENELSLEIGALGWFSDKLIDKAEKSHFMPKAGCNLDLVRIMDGKETILSSINVTINKQGIPEAQSDNVNLVSMNEILAEQATPGFIDPYYFDQTYFPNGMKLYQFKKKVTVTGIPNWVWVHATPFTGSTEQLQKLKQAYTELADIISSRNRNLLKTNHKEALKAWSSTTGDSEDDILLSLYPKDELEGGKAKMLPIKWDDYSVRSMNNGRMVQFYNKSDPSYSPLTYHFTDEDGEELLGYYAPIFSLIDGRFIPVI